ncbi:hypothetical protein [Streptomyces sp. NPDC059010]|uniref:hypothetical protein n=1 Tax=Streptomyces sp. NPDC059010 TaxID=3346695 RepID=UPI0036AB7527
MRALLLRLAAALTLAAAVSAAMVSCSPTADPGDQGTVKADARSAQEWALADGVVTPAEYRNAVDRFISCVRKAGYEVSAPLRSPVDGLTLLYEITPSGSPDVYNSAVEECNLSHISDIEPAFVEARPQVMDEELRRAVSACLKASGVPVTGKERNFPDFKEVAAEDAMAVQCVSDSARKMFPELPDELIMRG